MGYQVDLIAHFLYPHSSLFNFFMMIRYISLSFFMALFLQATHAQTALRAGPAFTLILGPYEDWSHFGGSITFEKRVQKHLSLGGTILFSKSPARSDFYKKRLVEIRPELRYYFKTSMDGLFAGVYAMAGSEDWKNVRLSSSSYVNESIYLGPGLSVGYVQKITENFDWAIQLNGAAHLGEAYFPLGAAVQIGYRF